MVRERGGRKVGRDGREGGKEGMREGRVYPITLEPPLIEKCTCIYMHQTHIHVQRNEDM